MKPVLLLTTILLSALLSACCCSKPFLCKTVTLENRRDMYFPQKVKGPYTRMLCKGIPAPQPVSGVAPAGTGDYKNVVGK